MSSIPYSFDNNNLKMKKIFRLIIHDEINDIEILRALKSILIEMTIKVPENFIEKQGI